MATLNLTDFTTMDSGGGTVDVGALSLAVVWTGNPNTKDVEVKYGGVWRVALGNASQGLNPDHGGAIFNDPTGVLGGDWDSNP